MEISDNERERIREWGRGLTGDIALRYATAGHSTDETFKNFVDRVAELCPLVRVKKDGDAIVSLPTLFIDSQVAYQALPLGRELEPFLSFLGKDGHRFADRIAPQVQQRLAQLQIPALIKVYITRHCPFCPTTVSLLLGLAANSDWVRLTVIDGELFADVAQKDRVSSVPTIILDDRFRWTGTVDPAELVTLMLDRDPANLGADALRGMIEDGNAAGVATMMTDRKKIFPAFIDLLCHSRWSVRLGAMVSYETLVEQDPDLAGQIVDPLMAMFAEVDDTVRGDLLHVLGESGNRAVMPFLAGVTRGDFDDEVRSAAQEAMDKLSAPL